jgi:hypothetical protein
MLDGVSDRANKVYDAMKGAGIIGEDRITKNMVMAALQELEQKGYARRKAREKAAGYFILPGK